MTASNRFRLTQKFLAEYEGKQPNWGFGDLSYFVYKRTYARIKEDGSQEEFFDTVKRVVEGCFQIQLDHCSKLGLPWDGMRAQKSAQKMFQKIWEFKFSPPGRGLWVMGTPIVDKIGSAALNNCAFISTKNISDHDMAQPFAWACDMLMLGVGVGFDTLGAGKVSIATQDGTTTYVIDDTREGWVESIRVLINSYLTPRSQGESSPSVVFDYSKIRPAGTPIKGFGGTASGPEPLKNGHEEIRSCLNSLVGKKITSTAIVDIMNMIGKFVVAGNVRRSAELAIGTIEDTEYITMKDPIAHSKELMSHRWASNNSVFAKPDDDFTNLIPSIAKNGEPGLIFLDNAKHYGRFVDGINTKDSPYYDNVAGFNPCAEQSLEHGEMCCLVETYPANHESADEFIETIKYAYLYAKSVTLLPTHDPLANSVMLRNRRIGLSQSGIQQAIKKFGYSNYCKDFADEAYDMVRHWDKTYSRWLGVPTSIKVTTVKPSGTVSLLAGATPGVHCTHSEFYYRTVRVAANDPNVPSLLKANYRIEVSVVDNAKLVREKILKEGEETTVIVTNELLPALINVGATLVVYFAIKENNFTKSKYDISLWEQLYLVRELQNLWSDNSVSCTITFKPEETKDLGLAIKFVAPYVKTLSFLPLDNHTYQQAPYQSITEEQYNTYMDKLKTLKLRSKNESSGEKYCTNDTCVIG
jgi:adenosylcobalamin-dependent ribonucleoside-triphosphate reductase